MGLDTAAISLQQQPRGAVFETRPGQGDDMILKPDGWTPPERKGAALALDLPLSDFHRAIAERIEHTAPRGKHHARCVIFHLGRAWSIRRVDPEMCAFRLLCAEEEAAVAVFHALRRRGYDGAKRLNPKNHRHKAALAVLLRAVQTHLATAGFADITDSRIVVNTRDPAQPFGVQARFRIPQLGWTPWMESRPPLEMELQCNGAAHDFQSDVLEVTRRTTAKEVDDFVRELSNERNTLLYAAPNGVCFVDPDSTEDALRAKMPRIFATLVVFELIDSHREHQLLVKQGLAALLNLISSRPKSQSDPSASSE